MKRLPRVPSRTGLKHSASAPQLAPVWEPFDEDLDDQPPWLNTSQSVDLPHSVTSAGRERARTVHGGNILDHLPSSHPSDGQMPEAWRHLLEQISAGDSMSLSHFELVDAMQHNLTQDTLPLRLQEGLVEERFMMRRELIASRGYKVVEGVEKTTLRNFALKIVHTGKCVWRGNKSLDLMQALHLIASFVDEVFCHPNYVCICMKWGMHEVDSSNQLSAWIVDASRLLAELLHGQQPRSSRHSLYLRVSAHELQRLLLRTACLDLYLNNNLWLPHG
mmetsp:Transcript_62444/g.103882  ORF Transcript_62444/g.103882 Transcript_62444/m.103882 type:complete len:276 (+) Transcript_62444:54-881(+)